MTDISFIVLLVMAPFIGSFLGVVVQRWGRETLWGRSHCDHCGHTLSPADLVPLLSWLALGGKCRYCGSKLGPFFPAIEVLAVVPVLWAATLMEGPLLIATSLFGWTLLTLSLIDWRTQRLPDALTGLIAVSGLAVAVFYDLPNLHGHLIGLLAGFTAFWFIGALYRSLRGQTGLGLGDAKLLAGLGAWVSWEGLAAVILLAAASAIVTVLFRALLKPGEHISLNAAQRIPFGPFLSLGGWIVWLYGPLVLR